MTETKRGPNGARRCIDRHSVSSIFSVAGGKNSNQAASPFTIQREPGDGDEEDADGEAEAEGDDADAIAAEGAGEDVAATEDQDTTDEAAADCTEVAREGAERKAPLHCGLITARLGSAFVFEAFSEI